MYFVQFFSEHNEILRVQSCEKQELFNVGHRQIRAMLLLC